MEIESSAARKTWASLVAVAQKEDVIIKHYTKAVSALISWERYQKFLKVEEDLKKRKVNRGMKSDSSSTTLDTRFKSNKAFKLNYSKQVLDIIANTSLLQGSSNKLLEVIKNQQNNIPICGTNFYILEYEGIMAVYTISGENICLVFVGESNIY